MDRYAQLYELWTSKELEDSDLSSELISIKGNDNEIYERFYTDLSFGTAGLRGVIGAGTNRMNIYTVRRATQGLAQYVKEKFENPSVAIAYDSRIKSELFAKTTAEVFAGNNIKVYIYKELMPTPMLSFAVRELGCNSGVVVTASHNPAQYNGYKVYGGDGCQLTTEASNIVLDKINNIDVFDDINTMSFDDGINNGIINYIGEDVIEKYMSAVLKTCPAMDVCCDSKLRVAFTPLNGAGNKPVRNILKMVGIEHIDIVAEQEHPDGNFPTCTYPNPEIRETLRLGLELAQAKLSDILIATDPDSDRVGCAVLHDGKYHLISGNEAGVLMLDFICRVKQLPQNPIAIKSIVTTTMADAVAKEHGVEMINVLTGFKYIGEQIAILESQSQQDRFILGFEESYGYLNGSYVRDKDAITGAMLLVCMAAYYKKQGKTLIDSLNELYKKHGYYYNTVSNTAFSGADGMRQMAKIMENLNQNIPSKIGNFNVVETYNYITRQKTSSGKVEPINLPKADVIVLVLDNMSTVVVRPSGTEPKLKVYYMVKANDLESCKELSAYLSEETSKLLTI